MVVVAVVMEERLAVVTEAATTEAGPPSSVPCARALPVSPPATAVAVAETNEWSSGLFDCLADVPICLYVCALPCCAFGHVMSAHFSLLRCQDECCACVCFGRCHHSHRREQIRAKHNLPARPFSDVAVTWVCPCLSLCQEARHAKATNPNKIGCLGM
mmetsp:Transcript_18650/g.57332  ORF Transcript_18650/g.57332 Transcript_18650/m.57332 type:complete len:158 (+) Transcript_18650:166-639(+)